MNTIKFIVSRTAVALFSSSARLTGCKGIWINGSVTPVLEKSIQAELDRIMSVYESDNTHSWDMQPDGSYQRRNPDDGQHPLTAQEVFSSFKEKRK